ncbi:hypothetical protein Pyn_05062 [Prunus yedoensis var. nudiflora]|uniref:Uncharacterized protein n=1 Tax=Prunus yedoensis var. nudiflora TaxID=2094558 RepID=A0A314UBV3_PRUYE|nr:hypothetical protein Pyn_05062 [Prunus yedoensis var. nudiflora]
MAVRDGDHQRLEKQMKMVLGSKPPGVLTGAWVAYLARPLRYICEGFFWHENVSPGPSPPFFTFFVK